MTRLDLLWWLGLAYLAGWVALPMILLPAIDPIASLVLWAILAPWSALVGLAAIQRLLPRSPSGVFAMFADAGSVRWAIKGWAPSLYLAVFQPVCFLSVGFQRLCLRALGAHLGRGALVTSRTIIREPHRVRLGADCLVGEYAHLLCAYQPRPKVLVVGEIEVGDRTMIGAYCLLAPGAQVGPDSLLEYRVSLGAGSVVGARSRIGAETCIHHGARIGNDVQIGKRCLILPGAVVPDGARVPPATTLGDGAPPC